MLKRFLKNEDGATAIEYGLIAALIGVAIIAAVTTVGTNLDGTFDKVAAKLGTTIGPVLAASSFAGTHTDSSNSTRIADAARRSSSTLANDSSFGSKVDNVLLTRSSTSLGSG